MFENVKEVWTGMLAEGGARQRLLDGHLLHLYYGADAVSKPIFFLITSQKPAIPELSRVVSVDRRERQDGSWIVALTLEGDLFADTFMGLCIELSRQSNRGSSPAEAMQHFIQTLEQWKEIFAKSGVRRLSQEQIRGLVGELSFALDTLGNHLGPLEMLNSWQGPFGTAQDFRLPGGELFEVKSVHSLSRWIRISSIDQLDPQNKAPLALVVIPVESCDPQMDKSTTLLELVARFRELIKSIDGAAAAFEQRLEVLGLDPLDEYYSSLHFFVSKPRFFGVVGDFPRLRRAFVPNAVDQVVYRLPLAALEGFLHEPDATGLWMPINESDDTHV